MAKYDPQKATDKQIRRASESVQDYRDGINAMTVSPTQLAKAKKQKMVNGFQKAMNDGSYEAGCDSISLDEIKRRAAGKGADRYSSGVADAAGDINSFHQQFSTFLDGHSAKINAMDDSTPEARINKMVANAKGIAGFKRSKTRR